MKQCFHGFLLQHEVVLAESGVIRPTVVGSSESQIWVVHGLRLVLGLVWFRSSPGVTELCAALPALCERESSNPGSRQP